jgi:hypothetical protein
VIKLFGYELSAEYLPGKANTIVDALSRRDEDFDMALALSSPTFILFDDLRREMTELEDVIHLLEMIRKGEAVDKWSVVNRVAVSSRRCGVMCRWWRLEKMSVVAATASDARRGLCEATGDVGRCVGGDYIRRMRMVVQSYANGANSQIYKGRLYK